MGAPAPGATEAEGSASNCCMWVDSETNIVMHRGVLMRSRAAVRVLQVVRVAFGALYLLLLTRLVLDYVRARNVEFVRWMDRASDVFYRPFAGIVPNGVDPGGHPIVWSLIVALVVYALVHAILVGIIRTVARTGEVQVE